MSTRHPHHFSGWISVCAVTLATILVCLHTPRLSAAPLGWACYATGGKVYKCAPGKDAIELYDGKDGSAAHARWGVDGRHVFYITTGNEIWGMFHNGKGRKKLASGNNNNKSRLSAFRPDPDAVLFVDGKKFYKVSYTDKSKDLIHTDAHAYSGEVAISQDGSRLTGRSSESGSKVYAIVKGGASKSYGGNCSASISANGKLLTHNVSGHKDLEIFEWNKTSDKPTKFKTLHSSLKKGWDNQAFAANSSEYIVYKVEDGGMGSNGKGIGVVAVSTGKQVHVTNVSTNNVEHPDFFVGELPDISTTRMSHAPRSFSAVPASPALSKGVWSLTGRVITDNSRSSCTAPRMLLIEKTRSGIVRRITVE